MYVHGVCTSEVGRSLSRGPAILHWVGVPKAFDRWWAFVKEARAASVIQAKANRHNYMFILKRVFQLWAGGVVSLMSSPTAVEVLPGEDAV